MLKCCIHTKWDTAELQGATTNLHLLEATSHLTTISAPADE